MRNHPVTWIVIADGSRARILTRRQEGPGFDVIAEMQSQESHVPSHLLASERPGRSQESGSSARHAIEPRHDPHQERLTAFILSVATYLNEQAAGQAVDGLILFAPPHALGQLREMLDERIVHKIRAEAPKDLTKLPIAELPAHLEALR